MAEITSTRAKFTETLEHYYTGAFAPLKKVVDRLEAGLPVTGNLLRSLPAEQRGNNGPLIEFPSLNIQAGNSPLMI